MARPVVHRTESGISAPRIGSQRSRARGQLNHYRKTSHFILTLSALGLARVTHILEQMPGGSLSISGFERNAVNTSVDNPPGAIILT